MNCFVSDTSPLRVPGRALSLLAQTIHDIVSLDEPTDAAASRVRHSLNQYNEPRQEIGYFNFLCIEDKG